MFTKSLESDLKKKIHAEWKCNHLQACLKSNCFSDILVRSGAQGPPLLASPSGPEEWPVSRHKSHLLYTTNTRSLPELLVTSVNPPLKEYCRVTRLPQTLPLGTARAAPGPTASCFIPGAFNQAWLGTAGLLETHTKTFKAFVTQDPFS